VDNSSGTRDQAVGLPSLLDTSTLSVQRFLEDVSKQADTFDKEFLPSQPDSPASSET